MPDGASRREMSVYTVDGTIPAGPGVHAGTPLVRKWTVSVPSQPRPDTPVPTGCIAVGLTIS